MGRTTVDLSIGGMTCASCVAALEEALGRVPGVERVSVNLATERATLTFDPKTTSVQILTEAIEDTGYQVRSETITLPIQGMSCAACVAAIETALRRSAGVRAASVNLATSHATVTYLPSVLDPAALRAIVEDVGYEVPELSEGAQDREQVAHEQELGALRRKFTVGAGLSVLVLLGSMPDWLPWWPTPPTHPLTPWALTTPVQFWVGWQFLRGFAAALRHRGMGVSQ